MTALACCLDILDPATAFAARLERARMVRVEGGFRVVLNV